MISLGDYLCILASEWQLLDRSGADKTQTEMELYYALQAAERLDLAGETLFGLTPNANGFLMRGNMDELLLRMYSNFLPNRFMQLRYAKS